jgi:hypothetical protein
MEWVDGKRLKKPEWKGRGCQGPEMNNADVDEDDE